MKRLVSVTIALAVLASLAIAPALGAEKAAKGKGKRAPIRVLVTIGGHDFEQKPFYEMFDKMRGITYKKIELPKEADLLKPGLEKDFDVILMYDMVPAIKPEQQQAFVELLKTGIGVVSWHHNMGANQDWNEFRKIIGGKFCTKECEIDGKPYKISTWDHDQDLNIAVADDAHEITKGIKPFTIHDEVYKGYWVSPEAKVLLTTDHPKNSPQIAWVTKYGNSPVFYLMLGHDSKAWANPDFQRILVRGIRWAAKK